MMNKLKPQRDLLNKAFEGAKGSAATKQVTAQMFDEVTPFSEIMKEV